LRSKSSSKTRQQNTKISDDSYSKNNPKFCYDLG